MSGKKKRTPAQREESAGPSGPPDGATLKKARRFLKDVERLFAKHRAKLSEKDQEKVTSAMESVRAAMEGTGDGKRLSTALKELDARVDQVLGFAKKSTSREYVESIVVAIAIALVLRAFVVEAFKIPTGSMIPTLAVGDHIFVNKFIYGLRVPFSNMWFVEWGTPERGDVIVFRYPMDLSKDYIKRVVAVAGDEVRVDGNEVYVNGKVLERNDPTEYRYVEEGEEDGFFSEGPSITREALAYPETSQGTDQHYTVLYEPSRLGRRPFPAGHELDGLDCAGTDAEGHPVCKVKPDYVFCMGDNRDNSSDSRVWGGVPITYVKGKAMFVWWSWGTHVGVRWDRLGHVVH
ncbi:MAG: signal peptidase I [Deltaproteobacteria bacterium]|nr:signal peptidase I [Deltaproteobacteria bacterium]